MNRYLVKLSTTCMIFSCAISSFAQEIPKNIGPEVTQNKLDRLFTTRQQRTEIDRLKLLTKKQIKTQLNTSDLAHKAIKAQQGSNSIKVHGVLNKENGLTHIWIRQNGNLKQTSTRHRRYLPSSNTIGTAVSIKIDGQENEVKIKPGQTYLRDKNQVYDNWQLNALNLSAEESSLKIDTASATTDNPENAKKRAKNHGH